MCMISGSVDLSGTCFVQAVVHVFVVVLVHSVVVIVDQVEYVAGFVQAQICDVRTSCS